MCMSGDKIHSRYILQKFRCVFFSFFFVFHSSRWLMRRERSSACNRINCWTIFLFLKDISAVVQRDNLNSSAIRGAITEIYSEGTEGRVISLTEANFIAAEECNYYFRLLQPWPVSATLAEERKLSRACASIDFRSRLQMAVQLSVFDKIAVIHYIAPYLLWLDCTSFILILQSTYHIFVISRTTMDDLPVLRTSNDQESIGT